MRGRRGQWIPPTSLELLAVERRVARGVLGLLMLLLLLAAEHLLEEAELRADGARKGEEEERERGEEAHLAGGRCVFVGNLIQGWTI